MVMVDGEVKMLSHNSVDNMKETLYQSSSSP